MKAELAVSLAAHFAFLLLVILPGYHGVRLASPQVINVRLLGETRPAEKPPAPMAAPKKEEPPKPKEEVKTEPEKPKMVYETKTKTRKTEPKAVEAPGKTPDSKAETKTASSQPASGAKSSVRVDDEDFRFAYYLEIVKERISFNWSPPPVAASEQGVMSTVYFKISRDGRISGTKLEQTSKFDLFDRSAVRAVNLADPLPPLPAAFKGRWLGVHFEFEQTSG